MFQEGQTAMLRKGSASSPKCQRSMGIKLSPKTTKRSEKLDSKTKTKTCSNSHGGNGLQKNVAWQICHSVPRSKRKPSFVLPQWSELVDDTNAPVLEMLIVEGFCNMNKLVRSKLFAKTQSQNSKWKQAKWFNERGPIFSVLAMFRSWLKEEKNPIWCKENGLNVGAMHALWEQCRLHLSASPISKNKTVQLDSLRFIADEAAGEQRIYEMLLTSHGDELYVYSGEPSIGYVSLSNGEQKQIRQEYGFNSLGQIPQYVMLVRNKKLDQLCTVWLDSESVSDLVKNKLHCSVADIKNTFRFDKISSPYLGTETKKIVWNELKDLIANEDVSINTEGTGNTIIQVNTPTDHVPGVVDKIVQGAVVSARKTFSGIDIDISKGRSVTGTFEDGMVCNSLSLQSSRLLFYVPVTTVTAIRNLRKTAGVCVLPNFDRETVDGVYVSCTNTASADELRKNFQAKVIHQTLHTKLSMKSLSQFYTSAVDFVQPIEVSIQVHKPQNQSIEKTISLVYSSMGSYAIGSSVVIFVSEETPKQEKLSATLQFTRSCSKSLQLLSQLTSKKINGKPIVILNRDQIEDQVNHLEIIIPKAVYRLLAAPLKRRLDTLDPEKPDQWYRASHTDFGYSHIFIETSSRMVMNQVLETTKTHFVPFEMEIHDESRGRFLQSTTGELYLQHIMALSETHIEYNIHKHAIQVYGLPYHRNIAEKLLSDIDENIGSWNACAIGDIEKGIELCEFLEKFVPKYDPTTRTLQGVDAIEQISLDKGSIIFKTEESNKKSLPELLDIATSKAEPKIEETTARFVRTKPASCDTAECCSCFEELSLRYVYITEGCGHIYCRSCIFHQINTSIQNTIFPMLCAGCNDPLPLCDVSFFLKTIASHLQTDLVKRSISNCTRQHPDAYLECPSHVCDGVVFFENKPEDDTYRCSTCKATLCMECKTLDHHGLSCKDNKEMFHEWKNQDPANRKMCPNCKMGIQKNGGCENVTCATCKKYICWKCLEYFGVEDECYKHLRHAHGGYN